MVFRISLTPCQDISVAGLQKGLENGKRSGLFFEVMRLLNGLKEDDKPRWLLVENVKNLLSVNKGFDFLRLLCEMEQAGYLCEWQLLNSKDFGVPQNRERVFIVGHLGDKCRREVFPVQGTSGQNPNTLHQIGQSKWVNGTNCQAGRVYDKEGLAPTLKCPTGGGSTPCIIDDTYGYDTVRIYPEQCPTLRSERSGLKVGIIDDQGRISKELKIHDDCPTLRAQAHGNDPKVIKVLGNYSPSGHTASRVVDPDGLAPTVMENHGTVTATVVKPVLTPDRLEKRQNGRRMKENGEPMFTLTSQDRHGVCLEYGSDYLIRKLTPRECWRLQGFPDEYIDKVEAINMSANQMYKQAGNAVTVNVAYAIGKKLKEIEDEDTCSV